MFVSGWGWRSSGFIYDSLPGIQGEAFSSGKCKGERKRGVGVTEEKSPEPTPFFWSTASGMEPGHVKRDLGWALDNN